MRLPHVTKSSGFYLIDLGYLIDPSWIWESGVDEISIGREMNLRDYTCCLNPVLFLSLTHARVFAHVLSAWKMFAQDICFALPVITWGFLLSPNLAKMLPCPPFTWHHTTLLLSPPSHVSALKHTFLDLLMQVWSASPPGGQASRGLALSLPLASLAPRTVPDTQSILCK